MENDSESHSSHSRSEDQYDDSNDHSSDNPFSEVTSQPSKQKPTSIAPGQPEVDTQDKHHKNKQGGLNKPGYKATKSEKLSKKRRQQRHNRQTKRREYLETLTADERAALVARERAEMAENEVKVRKRIESGRDGAKDGTIVLDCAFESCMSDRENKSLISQLKHMYSRLKKSPLEIRFLVTQTEGRLKSLSEYHNILTWPIKWSSDSLESLIASGSLNKSDLVYLSPDSETTLTQLNSDKIYILGGLVDGSVQKNATKDRASKLGIDSAKLDLQSIKGNPSFRNCLNINDVFSIIVDLKEGKTLMEALINNTPKRLKEQKNKGEEGETKDKIESPNSPQPPQPAQPSIYSDNPGKPRNAEEQAAHDREYRLALEREEARNREKDTQSRRKMIDDRFRMLQCDLKYKQQLVKETKLYLEEIIKDNYDQEDIEKLQRLVDKWIHEIAEIQMRISEME